MSKTTKNIEYNFSAKDSNVSSTLDKIGSSFDKVGNNAQKSTKNMNSSINNMKKLGNSAKQTSKEMLYMNSSLSSLATKLHNSSVKNERMSKTLKDVSSSNKNAVSTLTNLKNELKQLSSSKDIDIERTKRLEASTKELGTTVANSKSKLASMEDSIKKLNNTKRVMLENLTKAEQKYGKTDERVKQLRNEYNNFCSVLGRVKKEYNEEASALSRLNSQYDQHKAKVKVFGEKAREIEKAKQAVDKLKSTNEALYNKELALHNSIQKTNRQIQSKALQAKKTSTEINNYRDKVQNLTAQLKNESQAHNLSISTVSRFESKLRMVSSTLDTYSHKITRLKNDKKNLANTIKEKEVAFKKLAGTMKANGTEADRLANDIAQLKAQYNALDGELNEAQAEFDALSGDVKQLESQLNSAKQALNSTSSKLKAIGNDVKSVGSKFKTAGKEISSFGNILQQTGRGLINVGNSMRWMTMASTAVFGGAIKSGLEFDKAMAELASTIDTTELGVAGLSGTMETLEERVRGLAKATIFSPSEVADGMKYLSLAGYSTADMLSSIEPMLKMAQIGSLGLSDATNLLTDAMASYRMEVKDTPKFLDAMAKVQATSNTNVAQATEAFIWAGGTLADYNVSLEESASIIGILANQGLKGAQAGRSLSSIMVNLTKESGESYEALKKLAKLSGEDVFAFDKKGNYKGLEQQLKTIKKALYSDGITEQDRNTIIQSIAGKTQMKTFTKLMGQINGEYDTLKSKIRNADGALNEMHETVSQSSWAKFKEMLSAIQEALLNVWETIQPLVMFLIQKITDLANKFSSLSSEQQLNIIKFVAMAGVLPIIIKYVGFFILAIGTLVKAFGWIVSGIGAVITFIGMLFSGIGRVADFFINFSAIMAGIGAKITEAFKTVAIYMAYLKDGIVAFFSGIGKGIMVLVKGIGAGIVALAGFLSLPIWAVVAIIVALVGVISWMVSAWKRGFDEMASPIENLGNMLKTMGEDIGHFFISIFNSVSGFIGKLTGKSEEEIEKMKKLSKKDKDAIDEGYSSYKDKKTQEKEAKKQAKAEAKAQKQAEKEAKKNDSVFGKIGNVAKGFTDTLSLNFDDGGFFDEFGNFSSEYEQFANEFNNKKNEADFKTNFEADVLGIVEAEDKLKTLESEYDKMEVDVELAKDAVAYCNDKIQDLISEKRELEINPETNKKRLGEIEKELEKLGERREANLEIIAKGDEKLKEIEEARNNLEDKKITITTQYEEIGKGEELDNLLKEETFYRKFGYELLHDDFEADVAFIKEKLTNIPNEIGEIEQLIAVETDPVKKNQLIDELTALQEQQIMMELTLEYVQNTESLQQAQTEIDNLNNRMQELNVEASKIEWVSKQGIELTAEQKARLQEIKNEKQDINNKIKEQTGLQEQANKALKDMDNAGNLDKVVEYVAKTREENIKLAEEMGQTSEKASEISTSIDSIDFTGASTGAEDFDTKVDNIKTTLDEVQQKASEGTVLNIDTSQAEASIQGISSSLESSFSNIGNIGAKLENIKNTCASIKLDGLTSSLAGAETKMNSIRTTLISINNIASSTSVVAFTNAGQALVNKLQEARQKVLDTSNVARNYGVSAMQTMGQALGTAIGGARDKVLSVANVARNYGASAMRAMGQALLSQLNSAHAKISAIASTARSIRISIPTGGGGGSTGGGNTRSLLTAQSNMFSIPNANLRTMAFSSAMAGNTSNTNSFNFNIDRVVMEKGTDIKQTAKQFTIMCQREGLLK